MIVSRGGLPRWRKRRSVLSRQLSALLLVFAFSGTARAQNYHYGMNTLELTRPMADKMTELGAGVVRLAFGWDVIEPGCKGCFDFTITDAWRDEARRTGRTIFATLSYAPAWANGGGPYSSPPLNLQDWYDFVFTTVSRYRDDIHLWGTWNEPDLDVFLKGADLKTARSLALTARAAILAANPRASVLGPEVSHLSMKNGWFAAAMADFGDLFDIVTVHWYVDGPSIESMMDRMVRPLARGRPIWLSEAGLKPCASIFGEIAQALFYDRVLTAFQARRDWWTGVLFYDLFEPPNRQNGCGSGITRSDWSNRPAFTLLQRFIAAHP